MSSKLIYTLVGLIILVIAVEAGYFWGLRRSASFTTPQINISAAPTPFPTPFPASVIPGLLSYRAAVAVGQNSVDPQIWLSEWTIGQGGSLVSLTENSITLDYFDSGRKDFNFLSEAQVIYSQWSNSKQQSSPSAPAEFTAGDNVGIMFTIETTSGNFKRVEITKNVD